MEPVALTSRIWWLTISTLVALAFSAMLTSGAGAPGDEAYGSPPGDGIWETEADWVVEDGEDLLYENLTVNVNGNITIDFGGKLTLRSVKLVMNCTEDLEFQIRIATGGELVLTDIDGDPITTSDRTELRSWFLSARYTIQIDGGAKMSVLQSRISDVGDADIVGLKIESDDVLFDRSVMDSFSSIFVDGASPVFKNTRITGDLESSLYFRNSGALLEDCRVINCYYGINAKGTPSPQLTRTDVANCFFPMNLEQASISMNGGLLEAAPYGTDIRLNQSSQMYLFDVTFNIGSVVFLDDTSKMDVSWTLDLRVTDQEYQPLENASVEVNDSRGMTVFSGITGPSGTVSIELLDRIINATSDDVRNPHSVRVDKDKYHAFVVINVTSTMNREVTVLTNIAPIISVSSPLPGIRVVMGQDIEFNAEATYDPNGDPMTFEWTTNIGDRLLYSGPETVFFGSLLLGESEVTLTVSDGEGGVNSTTIPVEVLQASQQTLTVTEPQFIARLEASYGGSGQIVFEEAVYPKPYPPELIGIFLKVHFTGDAIFDSGDIMVSYSTTLIPYGMDESSLGLVREDGGIWVDVPGSQVDIIEHNVYATVSSYGVYAVRGHMPENIPPRLWMVDGVENVAPYDLDVGPGDPIDISFVVDDELPSFARLEVEDLPDFLHLDGTTKRIVGIAPFEADSYYLVLTATDIGGLSDRATIYLNVTSSLAPPQLWSEIIDPSEGDIYTTFEISVVYVSIDNLAPVYVRADFGDNETAEMVPLNITDDEYMAGVMYHVFVRLEEGSADIFIEAFDGRNTNRTEVPLKVEVSSYSLEVTNQEIAIIIVALIGTVIIILIIRQTSEKHKTLKEAHYGLDKEDELEYIEPEETSAEEEVEADETEEEDSITGDDGQIHVVNMDEDDMRHLDEDVERLDGELDEIDSDIDRKEEDLARIDEEIEDIIDELDEDRNRVS